MRNSFNLAIALSAILPTLSMADSTNISLSRVDRELFYNFHSADFESFGKPLTERNLEFSGLQIDLNLRKTMDYGGRQFERYFGVKTIPFIDSGKSSYRYYLDNNHLSLIGVKNNGRDGLTLHDELEYDIDEGGFVAEIYYGSTNDVFAPKPESKFNWMLDYHFSLEVGELNLLSNNYDQNKRRKEYSKDEYTFTSLSATISSTFDFKLTPNTKLTTTIDLIPFRYLTSDETVQDTITHDRFSSINAQSLTKGYGTKIGITHQRRNASISLNLSQDQTKLIKGGVTGTRRNNTLVSAYMEESEHTEKITQVSINIVSKF